MKYYLSRYSSILAVIIIAGGMLILSGWQLDIEFLKRPMTGTIAVNPITALCFILAGISLLSVAYSNTKRSKALSVILAFLIITIALLRIIDGLFHAGIAPDHILFSGKILADNMAAKASARMASNSAISFLLTGIALLLMHFRAKEKRIVLQLIALLIVFLSIFSILGYVYDAPEFRSRYTTLPMAPHSAILFLVLSIALLFAYPKHGVMADFTGSYTGTVVARRLTPFGILVPILLGLLGLLSHRYNLFSTEFSIMLQTLTILIIAMVVIWYNATLLNKRDTENKENEYQIRENETQIQAIFNSAPDAVIVINETGKIIQWNPKAELMFGWTSAEVTGKQLKETIIPERYRAAHSQGMDRYLQTGEAKIINKTVEIEAITKDGQELNVALNISPATHKGQSIFIGFIRDVTEHITAQKKIGQSEDKFRRLLELAPDAIVIVDSKGVIQIVNVQVERLFGYSRNELIGKEVEILMPLRYDKTHHHHRANYFNSPKVRQMGEGQELFGKTKDGKEFPVEISLGPLETDEGLFVSAAIRDISQRRKAEEKFRGLLESAPDAIVIVNEQGIIQLVNAQTLKLFGYSRAELTGQKVEVLMPLKYGNIHTTHRNNYFTNPKVRQMGSGLDLLGRKKSGEVFPVEISLSPLETEEGMLVTAAIRDISEKKRLEKEIKDANVNLELKITQRTAELERKNRDLEQFAYVASHDLQEPLRTTSSFVQMLNEKYKGKLDEEADQILEYMVNGSERMKVLIKDLLDYSRIGRKTELKDIDCNVLIKEVMADLDTAFKEAEAMIEVDHLPKLRGYPTELKLLFQNLVSNALKFRKKDVGLVIRIWATSKEDHWEFAVNDNGLGIESKFRERIFVIFQRLHVQSEYEGSGIGLAHCKKIAELHNGTIWVDSMPGKGSTFYFTIQKM